MEGNNNELTVVQKINSFAVFRIIFRSSKRRISLLLVAGLIFFFLIGFVFSSEVSYKRTSFSNYSSSTDWFTDGDISAYYSTISPDFNPNYSRSYLDGIVEDFSCLIRNDIPQIDFHESTALMSIELYQYNNTNFIHNSLNVFNGNNSAILDFHLKEGRMPASSNELLYYKTSNSPLPYSINDTILLKGKASINSVENNFTIVGIVEDLNSTSSSYNYSADIIDWSDFIEDYRYLFTIENQFFTIDDYYFDIINSYPLLTGGRAVLIDFNYDLSAIDIGYLYKYLKNFINSNTSDQLLVELDELFIVGSDLFTFLQSFNHYWLLDLILLLTISTPFLYLVLMLNVEAFNSNKIEIHTFIRTLKLHGITNEKARNVLFFENLLLTSVSTIVGLLLGFVFGSLFGIDPSSNFKGKFIFASIHQPLFQITLPLIFCCFLIMYFVGYTKTIKSTNFRSSLNSCHNNENKVQKFFSWIDLTLLFLTSICLSIGSILYYLFPSDNLAILVLNYTSSLSLLGIVSRSLIYLGFIFFVLLFFNLFSKLFIFLISLAGKKLWTKNKGQFSLSLIGIHSNRSIYLKLISLVVISGLIFVPCFSVKKSMEDHITMESNLASSGSDIIVEDWSNNLTLLEQIENLTGVEHTTMITLNIMDLKASMSDDIFNIKILTINNISDFDKLLDLSNFSVDNIDSNNLTALSANMSCFSDITFANYHKLATGSKFSTNLLGDVLLESTLTLVGIFDYFPLLSFSDEQQTEIHMVANSNTTKQILNTVVPTRLSIESKLLIKISEESNSSKITNELESQFGLSVITKEEI
ncbi:MAG: hypothetical protein ACFFDW_10915, partial [Candidatus Thorarchaeota archaeon]